VARSFFYNLDANWREDLSGEGIVALLRYELQAMPSNAVSLLITIKCQLAGTDIDVSDAWVSETM